MEEHELMLVKWVNALVPGPTIPMHVIMETIVVLGCMMFFALARLRFSVESPGRLQQALELLVEFIDDQLESNIGHGAQKYLNIVGTLTVFILSCNLIGLIPGFGAPTSSINVTAGCAIIVFFYYQFQGMKEQGVLKYLKHFIGPIPVLAPLMVPIEIIGHLARPFSLSVRLFANIYAEESVIAVFFGLIPLLIPLPFMVYAIFGGLLQTFIFVTLTMVYLGGAVAAEEH